MLGEFSGELLRLARQYRGFNQRDFAAKLHVEPSTVSRIENNVLVPTPEFLSGAANTLSVPKAFFLQQDSVYGLPVSVHPMWRKKTVVPQREIDRTLAELNLRIIHLRRLLGSMEYEPELPLPEFNIEENGNDAEKVAALVRRTWMMPNGPIADLTGWVERAGCFVIQTDLPDTAMDGVTLRVPNLPPCIFLHQRQPADRMRYSLAHELGHLVMHRFPTPSMEREANDFAGALLMPRDDLRPYFASRRIDLALLASLKPEWRVSMQSLLYRAQELGAVTANQARYLWQQFNVHRMKMREPPELDFPYEQPTLMRKVLSLHLDNLGYTIADLSRLLLMEEAELGRFHDLSPKDRPAGRPPLRIVS